MATARTRSTAGTSASRLATTVAREIELLATRRERLRDRQQACAPARRSRRRTRRPSTSRQHDLDRLLGTNPPRRPPRPPAARRRHAAPTRRRAPARHRPARRHPLPHLVRAARRRRTLCPRGQPRRNLPNQRHPLCAHHRGERPGTYRLDPDAAQRINTLLVKARERLHAATLAHTDNAPQRTERLTELVQRLQRLQREITQCHRIAAQQTDDDPRRSRRPNGA